MSAKPARIMAVLVVHERTLEQVDAWSTLRSWLQSERMRGTCGCLQQLLIYDNSAAPVAVPAPDIERCRYVHDSCNGGTAAAYRCAMSIASSQKIEWLLLLDHDTLLPEKFLEEASMRIGSAGEPVPAAFVPWVLHGSDRVISPARVRRSGSIRPLRPGLFPLAGEHITAIASGCIVHVPKVEKFLPFPRGLWLDYVDHWIFAQVHKHGYRVSLLEQTLHHDLSVAAPVSLSAARLTSVMHGEAIYNRLLGRFAHLVYPWRLLWRLLRLTLVKPALAMHALKWIVSGACEVSDRAAIARIRP